LKIRGNLDNSPGDPRQQCGTVAEIVTQALWPPATYLSSRLDDTIVDLREVSSMRHVAVGAMALVFTLAGAASGIAASPRRAECERVRQTVKAQIDGACSCEGAATHSEYVQCVTRKLREMSACQTGEDGKLLCGPVPRACVGNIRRVATRSTCGSNEVTCCIAKQHACVNDPSPGDGNAQGFCAGTPHPCDKVTDCQIPKCVSATSAENCQHAGGTLGTSKDCTTACPR
jgi:hypothetical protein